MKKKLISLEAELLITGMGLVNFNGSTPTKYQISRFFGFLEHNGEIPKNCKFAKEHVTKIRTVDKEGKEKIGYEVKKVIDANLIRKKSLGNENDTNQKLISDNPKIKLRFLSQPAMIARGWMYTLDPNKNPIVLGGEVKETKPKTKNKKSGENTEEEEEEKETLKGVIIKRKSGVTMTDAIQIETPDGFAETSMLINTREGKRDSNSLYNVEKCGKIDYKTEIRFDVKQLQFISLDDNYDRMSFFEREAEDYIELIKETKKYDARKGVFRTTHDNLVGEQGIVLSENLVYDMIRGVIEKLLNMRIERATTYAETKTLVLKIDGKDTIIKTIEEFDELELEFGCEFREIPS